MARVQRKLERTRMEREGPLVNKSGCYETTFPLRLRQTVVDFNVIQNEEG